MSQYEIGMEKVTVKARVSLIKGRKMTTWDVGKLEEAIEFSERAMRAQLHKDIRAVIGSSHWAIVPMQRGYDFSMISKGVKVQRRDIDWGEVAAASGPLTTPFDLDRLPEQIVDAITSVRSEWSRLHYITSIRPDLTPSSQHIDKQGHAFLSAVTPRDTLIRPNQPMLECAHLYSSKSGGFLASLGMPHPGAQLLIPELVHRHPISASVFRTTSILPAFFTKLDNLLIARDFNQNLFSSKLKPDLALLATSCPIARNRDPGNTYQRLETLGDTLLKLVSALHTHLQQLKHSRDERDPPYRPTSDGQ